MFLFVWINTLTILFYRIEYFDKCFSLEFIDLLPKHLCNVHSVCSEGFYVKTIYEALIYFDVMDRRGLTCPAN